MLTSKTCSKKSSVVRKKKKAHKIKNTIEVENINDFMIKKYVFSSSVHRTGLETMSPSINDILKV